MEDIGPDGASIRWLLPAVFVIGVALAIAASLAPAPYRWSAMVFLPAAIMGGVIPLAIRRLAVQPVQAQVLAMNEATRFARRELHAERTLRANLRELDRGLDQASTEETAVELIRHALLRHQGDRACEVHLVDAVEPIMELRVATSDRPLPGERVSPWDALASRTDGALSWESTEQLDICPHVASRVAQPHAAAAVPLQATGRLLGVLYLFDREGTIFSSEEIIELEDLAAVIAARLAILRAAAPGKHTDVVDRLTGLPDRAAMQERVIRLLERRQPFTLAVADIDGYTALNVAHGRETGDRVLQVAARVARQVLRPDDLVGRIGGDELLFVLPQTGVDNATRALERLREELVLAQAVSDDPAITFSIGVIGSSTGGTIEALLQRAAGALNHAKSQGGNRVVVAQPAPRSN
ncbi:MAG: diguanylate cyclase [Actinomycetota bacterium]